MSKGLKSISLNAVLALLIIIGIVSVAAGQMIKREISIEGDLFLIPELGAMIIDEAEKVKVEFLPPANNRIADYKDVDLEAGDLILMFNGKKLKGVADFKKIYSALEIGDMVKLGIRRERNMMIVSFPKADESKLPETKMVIKIGEDDQSWTPDENEAGEGMRILRIDSDDGAALSLIDIGIILGEGENGLAVQIIMPDAGEAIKNSDLKRGDILLKVQGETVSTADEVDDAYSKILSGDAVELTFSRDGREIVLKLNKPVGQNKFMMKKH